MTRTKTIALRLPTCLAVAALAILAAPTFASAAFNPVGSGTSELTLSKGFLGLLKHNGVGLKAVAPAKLKAGKLTLPVSTGQFDPVLAKGNVELEGALQLIAGKRSVPLKSWKLKTTQRQAPFSVKVGGGQLKLATTPKLTIAREGFGDRVTTSTLKLSAKVAQRLDRKLRLPGVFQAGQALGTATTTAQPETVALAKAGRLELTLAPDFAAKLSSLFVAVNPVFAAEHLGAAFTLPIEGGQIAPDASSGTLASAGSLELIQQDGGQVFLREPSPELSSAVVSLEVDAEPSPPLAGKLGRLPSLGLLPGALVTEPTARTISVSGAALSLQAATAQLLNEAFATPQHKAGIFLPGEAFATLSFVATAE